MSQFGEFTPVFTSDFRERKVRLASIIQSGMNQYYIEVYFFRDKTRYVLHETRLLNVHTFMSIDSAARLLRQHFVRPINVILL